ncbi:hypothetical protein ACQ33O_09180 [Ferruginibacter sp. SUN002]|uniref:hypothetical protein n=1 Tax=Ferruginibacter sp. SUN002 TaxID=2937789 RepID=UPI003D368388
MKQISTLILSGIILLQLSSCLSSQAISKATYIIHEAVFLPKEKITNLAIVAMSPEADKPTYLSIVERLQSSLSDKKIKSNQYVINADTNEDVVRNGFKETNLDYQLTIFPIKDQYVTDELNNPTLSKQMYILVQKNSGEKIAEISIGIDRDESASKLGSQISGIIFSYLKKKDLI